MLKLLEATGADKAHVNAVQNEIGCTRFRPEEVAGASLHSPWPTSFVVAFQNAEALLARLASAPPR